ncbi:MAG: hypothetical protein IPI57_15745, partial [Candidatus Competibacteraceae bacterium]|nr:hypothetical protein [Candidatus Competibacteraceae bacterium]
MIIPDNLNPEETLYYKGASILDKIINYKIINVFELYDLINKEQKISIQLFILCLDWLYLIGLIDINQS